MLLTLHSGSKSERLQEKMLNIANYQEMQSRPQELSSHTGRNGHHQKADK